LALGVAERTGMTSDEIAHITAGQAYNERADFRLQPENGNLPQRLHGLAASLGTGAQLPPTAHPAWANSNVWRYGHAFFYQGEVPPGLILLHARAATLLWSLAIGLLVLLWARRLGGDLAGLCALALWAAEPTILANGPLATSDMCAAFWLTATCGLWWRALERTTADSVLAASLAFGLCAIAKFSVLIQGPVLLLISALWLKTQVTQLGPALRRLGLTVGAAALAAFLIIWTAFGFRQAAHNAEYAPFADFFVAWHPLLPELGLSGTLIGLTHKLSLLPDAYSYGLTFVLAWSKTRLAFLDGAYSYTGWWDFFPRAFFYKTSPALLFGLLLALIAAARARLWRHLGPSVLVLGSLVTLYVLISMGSSLNIGHRHLLPIYPALFIAAGWGLARVFKTRRVTALAVLVTLAIAATTLQQSRQAPLAWFSPLAGGSATGWKRLGDSSLDWGQGLPALADWWHHRSRYPDAAPGPLYLFYFGNDAPANYGLKPVPTTYVGGMRELPPYYELKPGWYAFGATMLQQIYSPVRGPWTLEWEKQYQLLRRLQPDFRSLGEKGCASPSGLSPERLRQLWRQFEQLRTARLCHYLRARGADLVLEHTTFLFSLTAQEITDYTERSASTLPPAAWQ
jgi:4-amino-4-deoxy-L-arabinose transferase-like glycosyltransferase